MLEGLKPPERKRTCAFRKIQESLEPSDQQILEDALANPDFTTHGLMKALQERGLSIAYQNLYRHRGHQCACFRTDGHYARELETR